MQPYRIPIWKLAPFFRLIIPMITGVLLQWYMPVPLHYIAASFVFILLSYTAITLLSPASRYTFRFVQGALLHMVVFCFALSVTWNADPRNRKSWMGHTYTDSMVLLVRLVEPLTEKERSYKTEAEVEALLYEGKMIKADGKVLLYFSKDSIVKKLDYGSRMLIGKPLQRIRNPGNPGNFDYERYAAFRKIFYRGYLKAADYVLIKSEETSKFKKVFIASRNYVISALRNYLPADKNIIGIAEALLLGYKEDLDDELMQAYSNTGVVHIIAISGLHVGLIYVLLLLIINHIPFVKRSTHLKVFLLLSCLWFFALLTGASPSVLRSALMFTCMVIGKFYFTRTSVYNTLAASAFLLLCINPYFLWDVGFQLSYLAVAGIVWLQQPLCKLVYFKWKFPAKIWNMLSVTVAAQAFTFPLCLYYFHQFPNLFLIVNLLVVPLSSLLLFTELVFISFSWIPFIAGFFAKIIALLIWLMNKIILTGNKLPFSVWNNINANVLTTWLLYFFIFSTVLWLLEVKKVYLIFALGVLLVFVTVQFVLFEETRHQKKIIIYNISQHRAVDVISGSSYFFWSDEGLKLNAKLQQLHLKPARSFFRLKKQLPVLPNLVQKSNYLKFYTKSLMLIDSNVHYSIPASMNKADILLITGNPAVSIAELSNVFSPSIIVFDASNSLWKIAKWKKQCLALALPCYSIPEQGAFVLNIEK